MPSRPPRLHEASTLIIWGSRYLTLAERVVLFTHWRLDTLSADGCYIGCASMSQRLGGEPSDRTIEGIRTRFGPEGELRLLFAFKRAEGRNKGWVLWLPEELQLQAWRPPKGFARLDDCIETTVARFDAYCQSKAPRPERIARPPTYSDHAPQRGVQADTIRTGAYSEYAPQRAMGGRGEGLLSTLKSESEAQLLPAVENRRGRTEPEDTSARAREQKDEGGPRRVGFILKSILDHPEETRS